MALEHESLLPLGLGHGEHLPAAEVPPHGGNVEAVLLCDGRYVHKLKPELYIQNKHFEPVLVCCGFFLTVR